MVKMSNSKPKFWGKLAYLNNTTKKGYSNKYEKKYVEKKKLNYNKLFKNKKIAYSPGDNSMTYNGGMLAPEMKNEDFKCLLNFGIVVPVQSNGSGKILAVYGSNPASCADWTTAGQLYDEFRVLAMRLHFVPTNKYYKGLTITAPAIIGIDRDDATAPTTANQVIVKESARLVSIEDEFWITVKMSGNDEATWLDAATSTVQAFCVKMYSDGLSNSITYGSLFIQYLVQFRGKGI